MIGHKNFGKNQFKKEKQILRIMETKDLKEDHLYLIEAIEDAINEKEILIEEIDKMTCGNFTKKYGSSASPHTVKMSLEEQRSKLVHELSLISSISNLQSKGPNLFGQIRKVFEDLSSNFTDNSKLEFEVIMMNKPPRRLKTPEEFALLRGFKFNRQGRTKLDVIITIVERSN